MVFQSENELEQSAIPFLAKNCLLYSWQVPLHNRVVDLAAIDKEGNLIGIEFKIRDWKRALKQASANYNSFDFIYVCLPGGKYLEKLKSYAIDLGIGVMVYDYINKRIKIEVEAKRVKRQWKPNVEYVREYIKKRGINGN